MTGTCDVAAVITVLQGKALQTVLKTEFLCFSLYFKP